MKYNTDRQRRSIQLPYPFQDDLLEHAQVLDIAKRYDVKFSSVEYFVDRFKLVPSQALDKLETEFSYYQVDPDIVNISCERIDKQWHVISEIEDEVSHNQRYEVLPSVMKSILVLYHSNVDCERVCSIVAKNKTKERASMTTETLSSLTTHKLAMQNQGVKCHTA